MKNSIIKGSHCRYHTLDDNYFSVIDNEFKAYVLGWIASDGHLKHNGFSINIHIKDKEILEKIRNIICLDLPIHLSKNRPMINLTINSSQIAQDIGRHLNLPLKGKKDKLITIPNIKESLKIHFIRGFFDGDGHVSNARYKKPYCRAGITSNSTKLLQQIKDIINIPCYFNNKDRLEWSNNNALDFLFKLYNNSSIELARKKDLYELWRQYVPGLKGKGNNKVKIGPIEIQRTRQNAILPYKVRASDVGYDLTVIEKIKSTDCVDFYTTGLKMRPDFGWFGMVVPRSSITKTGYIMANSVGILDRTYLGEIIIALHKINKDQIDLPLPYRIGQLIMLPVLHFEVVEVEELEETERGISGFGSTGN
jgi:deoxyuridine 5'-triphosphate nucleotidohydrolase